MRGGYSEGSNDKRHERRSVLQLRDRVRKIHDGYMPEKPQDAPCDHCGFEGICDVKSSLASRFFSIGKTGILKNNKLYKI